ncbi:MAG TPA: hypothetical protein VFR09_08245 [Alphaproteobacteria bacterium]|nr:hypothetical protein [Alphaproteobacteria bacterium]
MLRISQFLVVLLVTVALAGCAGHPKQDSYTSSNGTTTLIESDKDMCVHACNDDYERCMDQTPAENNEGVHGPAGMFGASADCRNDLHNCLPTCKGR